MATEKQMHKIVLVDDHAMVREGLRESLCRERDLTVCGEAEDRLQALEVIESTKPDIAIVDLGLKQSSGLELIKDIHSRWPRAGCRPDLFPAARRTPGRQAGYAQTARRHQGPRARARQGLAPPHGNGGGAGDLPTPAAHRTRQCPDQEPRLRHPQSTRPAQGEDRRPLARPGPQHSRYRPTAAGPRMTKPSAKST